MQSPSTATARNVTDEPQPARDVPRPSFSRNAVLALGGVVVFVHVLVNVITPYTVHRDELLYLAMGRHLQLFRMDFPPFIALVAELSRTLGDSLVAIRLGPALAHAAIVVLAALHARRYGGGRFAQLLAAGTVAACALFLRPGALFQPVTFDQLWWTAGLLVLAGIPPAAAAADAMRARAARTWLLLGVILGLGLLTKFSIAFIGVGMVAGVLLSRLRSWLLTPWPWLAFGIAVIIGSPSLAGQVALGFPFFSQMRDLNAIQLERISPAEFLLGQLMIVNLALPLALIGVAHLLLRPDQGARAVGWSCVVAFTVLMALHGKAYYAGPIYPALIGAGSAALAAWSNRLARTWSGRAVRAAAVASSVFVPLVLLLPIGLPILPPVAMAEYSRRLGIAAVTTTNVGTVLELPQDYADMLGWEAQTAAVARVYHALPPADRARAVLVADNYGEAGAIDFYGPRYGLPAAIAPVGSYWFFGPGSLPGDVVIKIGGDHADLAQYFRQLQLAAVVNEPWVVPEERNVQIWVCRGPYGTLQQAWPTFEGQN